MIWVADDRTIAHRLDIESPKRTATTLQKVWFDIATCGRNGSMSQNFGNEFQKNNHSLMLDKVYSPGWGIMRVMLFAPDAGYGFLLTPVGVIQQHGINYNVECLTCSAPLPWQGLQGYLPYYK